MPRHPKTHATNLTNERFVARVNDDVPTEVARVIENSLAVSAGTFGARTKRLVLAVSFFVDAESLQAFEALLAVEALAAGELRLLVVLRVHSHVAE